MGLSEVDTSEAVRNPRVINWDNVRSDSSAILTSDSFSVKAQWVYSSRDRPLDRRKQ